MSAKTIDVQDLARRIAGAEALSIVDIRSADERVDWAIPTSVHAPIYDEVRAGNLAIIDDLAADLADAPVVVVCNAGTTAQIVADELGGRGMNAAALQGGMRAWSAAHQALDIGGHDSSATVVQVVRLGKGCLSYLVGSGGEAVVIDPSLDAEVYEAIAREREWNIVAVADTHVHADHLSRARELADRTGARHIAPDGGRLHFCAVDPVEAGVIAVGDSQLEVVEAPGHTLESVVYLLDGGIVAFTGDTLFAASVGRPDLEATVEESRTRAALLHQSLRGLVSRLDDATVIAPGHAADKIVPGEAQVARLADVRTIDLLSLDKGAFVDAVTSALPAAPPNHGRIVELNEHGQSPDVAEAIDLEAGANRCAVRV